MPDVPTTVPRVVGKAEIAQLANVQLRTVHTWRQRGVLPPADYPAINGSEAWDSDNIIVWLARTGRLPNRLDAHADQVVRARYGLPLDVWVDSVGRRTLGSRPPVRQGELVTYEPGSFTIAVYAGIPTHRTDLDPGAALLHYIEHGRRIGSAEVLHDLTTFDLLTHEVDGLEVSVEWRARPSGALYPLVALAFDRPALEAPHA